MLRAKTWIMGTLLLLLLGSLLAFPAAAAGQGVNIAAVPAKVEFQIRPGTEQTQAVKVYNKGTEASRILAYTEDYSISPENQFEFFPGGTLDYSIAPWVSYSESDFVVEPDTYREITITLKVPADATIGGYASAAIFEGHRLDEKIEEGLVTVGRIGVPLLTTVAVDPSEIKQEGTILSMQVERGTWVLFRTDIKVTTTFENNGNTYLHYHAFTDITHGLIGSEYHGDHGESTALAKTQRTITYDAKGAWFGKYKVRVEVHYPPDRVLVQEQTVWVIPWLLILIVGILVMALGVGAWYWRRRRRAAGKGTKGDAG